MPITVDGDCSVCRESFGPNKTPHALRCGHSFCKECLDLLFKHNAHRDTVPCPYCRAPFTRQDIAPLRVNSFASSPGSRNPPGLVTVIVRTIDGSTVKQEVRLLDTILDLKKKMEKWTGIFPSNQRLIFSGKALNDDRTLQSYGIQNDYTVLMVRRYSSG